MSRPISPLSTRNSIYRRSLFPTNIQQRGGVFYFRKAVPEDLRGKIGKREIKLSLGTGYLRSAQRKANTLSLGTDRLYRMLRSVELTSKRTGKKLTDAQIQALANRWLKHWLDEAEDQRVRSSKPLAYDSIDNQLEALQGEYTDTREQLATHDHRMGKRMVEVFLDEIEETIDELDPDSPEYNRLAREFLKKNLERIRIEKNRTTGDYSDEVRIDERFLSVPSSGPQKESSINGPALMSIAEAAEKYIQDKSESGDWGKASQKDIPPIIRQFAEIVDAPGNLSMGELNRDHMRLYRETMGKLPSRLNAKKFQGKTYPEIVKMADKGEVDTSLSPKTLDTRFTAIRSFLNWAELEQCIDRSKLLNAVLASPGGKGSKTKATRTAFTKEDLERLFQSDEYLDDTHDKSSHFWLPILALFTGARAEELAQLDFDDVKKVEGIWCIDINDEGDEKAVKTEAGIRTVPLHSFLVDGLNFPGFVQDCKARGLRRVFAHLSPDTKGKLSHSFSKWFTRYRRACGVGAQSGASDKTFHSFRHTMISRCKHLDLMRAKVKEVVGHEGAAQEDITSGYETEYAVKTLSQDVVEKLDFHKNVVALEHLRASKWVVKK